MMMMMMLIMIVMTYYNPYPSEQYATAYTNPLNTELNPICHLLAVLGTHPILHVSRIRVNYNRSNTRDTYRYRICQLLVACPYRSENCTDP